jgi:hypothetical protein
MTPKEKAKELVSSMLQYQPFPSELRNEKTCYEFAKQCALIAVDEILDIIGNKNSIEESEYWQEVKQKIEAL